MANMTVEVFIDGKSITVPETISVIGACKMAGIRIPTLCAYKGLNNIGSCRVCVVEVEGQEPLVSACNTVVAEGARYLTSSKRVIDSRKAALQLILEKHNADCLRCVRNGNCELQSLGREYEIESIAKPELVKVFEDSAGPIVRDESKCISCGRCVAACSKLQNLGVWEHQKRGSNYGIGVADGLTMAEAGCIACGQCITHCPTGALSERDDVNRMLEAIADPEKVTVVQIAPATRTAWADSFGAKDGELGVERMCAALKQLGVDYVFDTTFTADLTIMEEGTELLNIVTAGKTEELPLITSCCPGWVNHAVNKWPQFVGHLSSAKSPMQMFGAVTKTWFAQKNSIDPEKIFSATLMPCTAKKNEAEIVPGMKSVEGLNDMDLSLTTREFARMLERKHIDPRDLEDVALDSPLGTATGAGVIFGLTGGVMEAALRTAYTIVVGEKPDPDGFIFEPAGPGKPWTQATFMLGETPLRCAVAHGLANADALLKAVDEGQAEYDFIEIMACPGGCAGGGGQPISSYEKYESRGEVLRTLDKEVFELRFSHENPEVTAIYEEFFGSPCSEKSEHYLHVHERQKSLMIKK